MEIDWGNVEVLGWIVGDEVFSCVGWRWKVKFICIVNMVGIRLSESRIWGWFVLCKEGIVSDFEFGVLFYRNCNDEICVGISGYGELELFKISCDFIIMYVWNIFWVVMLSFRKVICVIGNVGNMMEMWRGVLYGVNGIGVKLVNDYFKDVGCVVWIVLIFFSLLVFVVIVFLCKCCWIIILFLVCLFVVKKIIILLLFWGVCCVVWWFVGVDVWKF